MNKKQNIIYVASATALGVLNASVFAHFPLYTEYWYYFVNNTETAWTLNGKLVAAACHLLVIILNVIMMKLIVNKTLKEISFFIGAWLLTIIIQVIVLIPDLYWIFLVMTMNMVNVLVSYFISTRSFKISFKKA